MRIVGVAVVAAALAVATAVLPGDGWARSDVSVGINIGAPPPTYVYPAVVYPPPAYAYSPPVYGGVVVTPRYYHHRPHRHFHGRHGHWDRHGHR